jgi:hypothetical protein
VISNLIFLNKKSDFEGGEEVTDEKQADDSDMF